MIPFLLLDGISAGELIFVFIVVLLFFGSKSIPKIARTLGRGIRQIKDASQEIQDDIKKSTFDNADEINEIKDKFKMPK
ncbi:MAG: twin-arginine translocase TatA/TatE family subunit [Bacteroidota bacterium]|nr:twin-arginine translocase TatA/TatE family subunit [Bacteroidota bacterium]